MNERTLTAMYDSRGAAETARTELVAIGVENAAITLGGTESDSAGGAAPNQERGFWASLGDLFLPEEDRTIYSEGVRRGGYLLSARVPDDLVDEASDILERGEPIDLDERVETWRQSGWTGGQASGASGAMAGLSEGGSTYARETESTDISTGVGAAGSTSVGTGLGASATSLGAAAGDTRTYSRDDEGVIPVVEEEIRVGKREVGRGSVRVRSYVVERPIEEQVSLESERVTIERRPVDREVSSGDVAFQEREIEAVERGQEAVVSKTARVTEEIGIRKDVDSRTETVRDTVRKTEVEIDDDRTELRPSDRDGVTRKP